MTRDDVMKQIGEVTWEQLQSYLRDHGWRNDGMLGDLASIWHQPEDAIAEVVLPVFGAARDFLPRLADAAMAIAEHEERSPSDVIQDASGHFADLISVRVIHEDVANGTIPANDGVLLIEHARDLLVSAALSVSAKRRYFQGRSAGVAAFVDSLRLGQTARGSFVVNLIAPLPRELISQPRLPHIPLRSSVMTNLSAGLQALDRAVSEPGLQIVRAELDAAVEKGASANMCDALIGLSGQENNRQFEINITPSRGGGDVPPPERFIFMREKIDRLAKVSEYYKRDIVAKNKVVQGFIKRLDRPHGELHGIISVAAMVDGVERMVAIDLGPEDYLNAIVAHAEDTMVRCFGDVVITPRTATLTNTSGFEILPKGYDLFVPKP